MSCFKTSTAFHHPEKNCLYLYPCLSCCYRHWIFSGWLCRDWWALGINKRNCSDALHSFTCVTPTTPPSTLSHSWKSTINSVSSKPNTFPSGGRPHGDRRPIHGPVAGLGPGWATQGAVVSEWQVCFSTAYIPERRRSVQPMRQQQRLQSRGR